MSVIPEVMAARDRVGRRIISLICAGVLVLGCGFASRVEAQAIKPLDVERDANGVDLLSGKIEPRLPELSAPGASQLRLGSLQDLAPLMNGQLVPNTPGRAYYDINAGGATSEHFDCDEPGNCKTKKKYGGAFIDDTFLKRFSYYEGGTGKLIFFDLQNGPQGNIDGSTQVFSLSASYARYPNGETLSYGYDTYTVNNMVWRRPASISSSTGYSITLTYQDNSYGQPNWSVITQATMYAPGGVVVGRLTYSGSMITDLAGRQWTCTYCNTSFGGESATTTTALRLPGEVVDTFRTEAQLRSYGPVTHSNWVTKVSQDGVDWNYSYVAVDDKYRANIAQVTITAPLGYSRTVNIFSDYPNRSRITSVIDSLNGTTSYTYDGDGRLAKVTFPDGNAASVVYGAIGNIVESRSIARPGSGQADLVTTAAYGGSDRSCYTVTCYRPVWTRDAKGQQTDYSWGDHGGLLTRLEPADAEGRRRRTTNEYNGGAWLIRERICLVSVSGANLTCGTAAEQVREISYWGATFLPSSETLTDGAGTQSLTTRYDYDAAGRVIATDGPRPGSDDMTYNRYDLAGRRTWEIGPRDANGYRAATRTTYRDADDKPVKVEKGTVTSATDTALVVQMEERHGYDARRNVERTTVAGGGVDQGVTQFAYDARNRLDCTAVRMNPAAWGSMPSSACGLGTAGAAGSDRITRTVRDAESRVLVIRKAYGTPRQQDYATYTYSANGKMLSMTDANGNKAAMTWDGFDRQTRWNFPDKVTAGAVSASDYEQYGYDANGNRTSLRKRDGQVINYSYDALNRVTVKDIPGGTATDVWYGYDVRGLQTYARFGSATGEGVTQVYDGFGRLASSTTNMGGTARTLGYQYDVSGNRTRITHPDGTYFTYDYDGLDRVTTVRENGTTTVATIAYDNQGRRSGSNRAGTATAYTYDPISRLAGITDDLAGTAADVTASFGYSPASQMVSRTRSNNAYAFSGYMSVSRDYAVNGLNQYVSGGAGAIGYDANGNLTSDGAGNVFGYDVENRLTSRNGGVALAWDPLGRLYKVSSPTSDTRFLYDGDELVAEYSAGGTLLRRYVHGPAEDDPLLWYEGAGLSDRRGLQSDHQGSIVSVANSAGTLIGINGYDEYGIPNGYGGTGTANIGRFQYTGQAWIPELGMYHYKARIYSPSLGRFMQTDPIGYADQNNLYAYVGNDPVMGRDPTGTEKTWGEWFSNAASDLGRIPGDLADLGSLIIHGDLGTALGGMPPTLGGGVVTAAAGAPARIAAAEARAEVQATAAASRRAEQVHSALDPIAQGRRTTAVLETSGGRIVAGGGRDLTPAQRAVLGSGETAARAPGAHAEATALRQAGSTGSTPRALATNGRPICSSCAAEISRSGGRLTSSSTATWKSPKPWWKFW